MLTFFDYLRQRAYESVLAGAQEALEFLESQKNRREPKSEPKLPAPRLESGAEPPANQVENSPAQKNVPEDEDDLLPPPRRRGKPGRVPKEK